MIESQPTTTSEAPAEISPSSPGRGLLYDLLAWLALALATLAVLWPLGLTNRVLAGVDAYTYFTPYWAYRMAAMRAGQIPLWNPYLFLGVPFLANPQAAVLYPLHWPLSWLSSPGQALIWSALLHIWLAAGFTYMFGRRVLKLTRPAALLSGLLFGLGGYTLAHVENINQLNALAWFPAMLWLYEETLRAVGWRRRLRWGIVLALVITLAILAGHTQSTFIDLAGLGLYAVAPLAQLLWNASLRRRSSAHSQNTVLQETVVPGQHHSPGVEGARGDDAALSLTRETPRRLAPMLALVLAILLAAAQLLPTIELNGLGLRTGGLSFRQAVSFSLRPRLLAQSLLPPLGGNLAETFASEGYAEFAGYLAVSGLFLAAAGVIRSIRSVGSRTLVPQQGGFSAGPAPRIRHGSPNTCLDVVPGSQHSASRLQPATFGLLVLAVAGMLLALGAYDPLYYLLWRFVPGFDLFRAPARWLALYAFGMAGLAGLGLDALCVGLVNKSGDAKPSFAARMLPRAMAPRILILGALVLLLALLAVQQYPRPAVVGGWLLAGLLAGGLYWLGQCHAGWARLTRSGLIALVLAELWLGSRALPFTLATAPAVVDGLRNAPAALLAATASEPPAGRDRFLSLSDIRFDPGDLSDLRGLQADRLPAEAIERLVRAAKQMEVIAPNLSLLFRLPAVDGYDGGLLPLGRYVKLQSAFIAADGGAPRVPVPDGRLREQLHQVPPDRLLDLTGTRYLITDKQNDLWTGDVYYDLEQAVTLAPGQELTLDLSAYPPFSATALGIVSYTAEEADGAVAELVFEDAKGARMTLGLSAPGDTTWSGAPEGKVQVARAWPDWLGQGHDWLTVKDFDRSPECRGVAEPLYNCAFTPKLLHIRGLPASNTSFVLRGLSLIDRRTGAHQSITLSPRGDRRRIYSGDVKIYERTSTPGRAWLVHEVQTVAGDDAALARVSDPAFDPRRTAIVTGISGSADMKAFSASPASSSGAEPADDVGLVAFEAERAVIRTSSPQPGMLVLADANYPGWTATVDGRPVEVETANLLFRGVSVPAGSHEIVFTFRSNAWQRGVVISAAALATLAVVVVLTLLPLRARRSISSIV